MNLESGSESRAGLVTETEAEEESNTHAVHQEPTRNKGSTSLFLTTATGLLVPNPSVLLDSPPSTLGTSSQPSRRDENFTESEGQYSGGREYASGDF